jgi:hypothetical protein
MTDPDTGSSPPVPRLALSQVEAAESLGISLNAFKRYVRPHVRRVEVGTRMLFSVAELQRWLDRNARRGR